MLNILVKDFEVYDEQMNIFVTIKGTILRLEHSLLSLSKWESIWKKPFITEKKIESPEEMLSYIKCMTVNPIVDPLIYDGLTNEQLNSIQIYIGDSRTATTIKTKEGAKSPPKEFITSELIYYWMIVHNIPFDCEKWHLSRLLTLISVCNAKSAKEKKPSKQTAADMRALNRARLQNNGGIG